MTPKEKAKELFDKMYWHFRTLADTDICKQCALIAVDELIKETGSKYWYDIKQEIEQL